MRATSANKQIGNRAGEVFLLGFCERLNHSNTIQRFAKNRLHRQFVNLFFKMAIFYSL